MGMCLEALRLPQQEELRAANLIDLARQISTGLGEDGRHTRDEIGRPLEIVAARVPRLEGSEQSVVLEPVCVLGAELGEVVPQIRAHPAAEVGARHFEEAAA